MRVIRRGHRPRSVSRFSHFISAMGLPPLLNISDQRLLRGPFMVSTTITDNAAVNATLTTQSLWDKMVQGLYGASSSTPVKGVLHLTGAVLYINDSDYRGETQALKEALDNQAYLEIVRAGKTLYVPLRGHICEPWGQFDFKQATAADAERALQQNPPYELPRPVRVDLETDILAFRSDTAINWATGNIAAFVGLYGALCPKDFTGAMVQDTGCAPSADDPFASVDPYSFSDIRNGLGFSGIAGPIGSSTFGKG